MSYKHLNFKCVLLKRHALACLDPTLTVEISCSECLADRKSKQLFQINYPVCFPDLGSVLVLPKTFSDFRMHFSLPCYFLPSFQVNVEWILWINFVFCPNRGHFNWSLDDVKEMTVLDRNDFAMSCFLQLFPWIVFWICTSLTGTDWEEKTGWPLTMANYSLVNLCVSSLCLSCSCLSVGKLLALIIITLSSGVTALCKGVLRPAAWAEESLFY